MTRAFSWRAKKTKKVWQRAAPGILYSEIAEEIAAANGLKAFVMPTVGRHLRVVQSNVSDARFLKDLATKARSRDAFTAQLGTEASEDIAKVRGEAHRARLMLEWVHTKQLSVGRSLSLKAEAGGRFDGGDADRGSGVETGFRLGYLDANSGLDMAMLGRVLVVHESDYRDWGLGVQASWDPGEKQRGFRVSVTSTRGQDGGGRTTLWNNANTVTSPPGMGAMGMGSQSRMESEVAYGGLKALGLPGLLTPYSRLRWAGQGRELAWGTAWSLPPRSQLALPLMLELEALRRENRTSPADLAVLVRMSIPF